MIIVPRRKTNGLDWNRFVDDHPAGWWWQRHEWLDYSLAYDPSATDRSFAIVSSDSGRIVGVCPAVESKGEIRMGDDPCAGPLVEFGDNFATDMVQAIRSTFSGLRCSWRWNRYPCAEGLYIASALALLKGLRRRSWQTAIVSLGRAHRWKGVRKSYRSLINKAQRECNLAWGTTYWPFYEACHRSMATRPRPDATYRHQEAWVRDGFAQVFLAFPKGGNAEKALAASLAIEYKGHAYYASGPSVQPNLQHGLQWLTMDSLTKRGVETYELGWLDRHGVDDSIGFFKSGFGGDIWGVDVVEGVVGG